MSTKVIMDVDTGSDDAVAIMCALLSPDIDLVACCSVWGNLPVENTTENTLRVLQALGSDLPVYKGCGDAMVKNLCKNRVPQYDPGVFYDENGKQLKGHYDYLDLPVAKRGPEAMDAPSFYVDYLNHATEPVTLVPVGPLTNLGFALTMDPGIVKNIKEIVIMGGGENLANISNCAEANIWHDPEAAHIVINCGAKVTLVPLDSTHAASTTPEDCEALDQVGTFASRYAATLSRERIAAQHAFTGGRVNSTAVHDALALCAVIDPSVLQDVRHVHCEIGFYDFNDGATIIDHRCIPDEPNCYFAYSADREKLAAMMREILGRGAKDIAGRD